MLEASQIWVPRRTDDVDAGARTIARCAAAALAMPPSWREHGDAFPICTPDYERLGMVLPGTGIYLDVDLERLGITRKLPGVFDRSGFGRLLRSREQLECTISTYDGIIAARGNGNADDGQFSKNSFTSNTLQWSSVWQAVGIPGTGAYTNIPGGAVHTVSTVGALNFWMVAPTGGNKKYLLTFGFCAGQQINVGLLHDLLVCAGNILGNTNGAQTVNSTALTRYTTGVGVQMTFDVVSALGATPANLTVTYTNQAGTGSRATPALTMTASAIAQSLQPVGSAPVSQLASGDSGVQSVQSVQLSASMGGGTMALNLYKPLAMLPGVTAGVYTERDSTTQIDGFTEIAQDGSTVLGCLNMYLLTNTTSTGQYSGFIRSCAG